jgi:hemolysin activation/secretion protein
LAAVLVSAGYVNAQDIPSSEAGLHLDTGPVKTVQRPQRGGGLRLESTTAPNGAASVAVHIRSIEVRGATVLASPAVARITDDFLGAQTLAEVYAAAEALTALYGEGGYVLSRVIVPPQDLDPAGADVILEAVEGYVDQVVWPVQLERYRDVFTGYSAAITAERPVRIRTLERYLLLAGDLPGLNVSSRLEPSATNPRASTLVVDVTEKLVDAAAWLDNWGSEGRGPYQYRLNGTLNNLLGQHETVSVTYGGSVETGELQYLTSSVSIVLNTEGTVFSLKGTASGGAPGTPELDDLAYENRSYTLVAELSHPFIRTREQNLSVSGQAFASDDASETLGEAFSEDRLRGLRVAATYDQLDAWDGFNQAFVQFSKGFDGAGSTSNDNPLASREAGQVDFAKLEFLLSRDQDLPGDWSLFGAFTGQYAFTPLLAPEECSFGGRSFGRAFDSGALAGDHCAAVSAEVRYDLQPDLAALASAQLYAFADAGAVWRIAPAVGTSAQESAGSGGLGLRTVWEGGFRADAELARRFWGPDDTPEWRGRLSLGFVY